MRINQSMNDINPSGQPLDPRLKELLDLLKETPPRDPEAEARGQAKFLAEVDELFSEPTRPIASRMEIPVPEEKRSGWLFNLASMRPRLAFTSLMAILAIVLLFFGGAGATAFAAQGSLPGDALYSLKTSIEATQVRLARDAARQAQLHLDFAERRLDEIAALIAEGRFDSIDTATQEFEAHVQQAINALETVSAGDPQRAKALAIQISSALSRYSQILRDMLAKVPDPVKPVMERALLTSEEESGEVDLSGTVESMASDGLTINGQFVKINSLTEIKGAIAVGAQVKIHALQGPDGALIAREIEVTAPVEANVNENGNANLNENEGDVNLNENEADDDLNENEGQNQNANMNENEDDDNANLNENHNGNQNMNENDDHENDNGGSNQNFNDNHDDDHENSNRNDNSGSNKNDNEHENDNGGGGNMNGGGGNMNSNDD
jgi:Domain of unknown function (DUF5667)/Domain of unknown function (DUF5666)